MISKLPRFHASQNIPQDLIQKQFSFLISESGPMLVPVMQPLYRTLMLFLVVGGNTVTRAVCSGLIVIVFPLGLYLIS